MDYCVVQDIEDGGKKEEVGDLPASVKQTKKKTPVQRMGSSGSRRRVDILTAKVSLSVMATSKTHIIHCCRH